jgi:hypothetical protein
MFNIKLGIYPTVFLLSAISIPIFYFIKKRFFTNIAITIKDQNIIRCSPEEDFLIKAKTDFDKSYEDPSHIEKYNENIDPIFLDTEKYSDITKMPDSELELAWRRRILFVNTPRGNVIMFYDSFKQGFSYYSDQHISYAFLNAVAMKYVIIYRCRDFFIDEQILPQEFRSRILELLKKEDLDAINKKKEDGPGKIDTKAGPFAKFKSYVKPSDPVTSATVVKNKINLPRVVDIKPPIITKDQMKNKFIYLGKTMNWNILTKVSKKNKVTGFNSKLLSGLENNSAVQTQVFSYKNYKSKLSPL